MDRNTSSLPINYENIIVPLNTVKYRYHKITVLSLKTNHFIALTYKFLYDALYNKYKAVTELVQLACLNTQWCIMLSPLLVCCAPVHGSVLFGAHCLCCSTLLAYVNYILQTTVRL